MRTIKRWIAVTMAAVLGISILTAGMQTSAQEIEPEKLAAVESEEEAQELIGSYSTPVAKHGRLHVEGTNIKDENGNNYQLRGVSTHGINWDVGRPYVNREAFQTLRDDWGANTVRLAMYTHEYNGYCAGGNQAELKALVDQGVQAATDLGMYVIVDWHVLNDRNPNQYIEQSKAFFQEVTAKYKDHNNVIYEICNEPNGGDVTWDVIKQYANQIIPIIRANDPNAIIIVGTPTWSQLGMQGHTNEVADSPLVGYSNIMYSLHFYCAEQVHTQYLPAKVDYAISRGLPVFVSEFGLSEASGNGNVNPAQAEAWLNQLDRYNISYMVWSLSNKNESSALLQPSVTKTSGWSEGELTTAGQWIRNSYRARMESFREVDEQQVRSFVTRLYQTCLNREPEAAGLESWTKVLCNGTADGARTGYGFVFSQEYLNRNATNEQYIEMLYQVFLDRSSDASGMQSWLDAMEQGASRELVFKGFVESPEYTSICGTYGIDRGTFTPGQPRDQNYGVTSFVARLYTKALGRSYDVDGLNAWCEVILNKNGSPEAVAESFINSREFLNKNLSNEDYVKVLYRTFMGREYDEQGLNAWVAVLDQGTSRLDVLHGFSRSPEFANIMAQYGL